MLINLITDWRWPGERPVSFGWYHLMWLAIMIIVCISLCKFVASKHDRKKDNIVIFTIGTILMIAEIYKQTFYTLDAGYYQWYAFPYQFCSVPMFVAFFAPLLKEGKVKEALFKFLAFFGLIAGLAVMAYPGDCFNTSYVTILIHTMLWHSSMVVMGIYLQKSRNYTNNFFKDLYPGFIVFLVIVSLALIGNIISYKLYFSTELNTYGQSLNMFYISPYYNCSLPILSIIYTKVPYIVFLLCYFLAFFLGISAIWGSVKLIRIISTNLQVVSKKRAKQTV